MAPTPRRPIVILVVRHGGPGRHRRPAVSPHGVVNLCRLTWIKSLSAAGRWTSAQFHSGRPGMDVSVPTTADDTVRVAPQRPLPSGHWLAGRHHTAASLGIVVFGL